MSPAGTLRSLPPICILAGGLGTRLGERTASQPKALVAVAGKPFVHHQLQLLARSGATRVVLCVAHLGEQIERAVGDGDRFGISVEYAYDPGGQAGTAGAIRAALPQLGPTFLSLYGDTYLRLDYREFARAHLERTEPAQLAVLRNHGRWDRSNVQFDGKHVTRYDKSKPDPSMEWIDYGLCAFDRKVFERGPGAVEADLASVYVELAADRKLGGYVATERFYEIGTPEALAETDAFLRAATA